MPALPVDVGPWLALPIGVAFGAILERAGLGSARTISRQLSFADWTVVKVMFSAIVTAMLALYWSEQLGWLELSRVAMPETDVVPQLLGALVFGVGFAMASLCPGTACVSAASGRRDGLAALTGIAVGSMVTAELWPALGQAAVNNPRSAATLSSDLGVPAGVVVLGISVLAIGAFVVAARMEGPSSANGNASIRQFVGSKPILVVLTLALLASLRRESGGSRAALAGIAAEISREADHVDPIVLADWIRERRPNLRVIEVVESPADIDPNDYVIPGSSAVTLSAITSLEASGNDTIVLYSAGGTHAAQAWVLLRARNVQPVFVLRDGLAAWEDEVLAPSAPSDSSAVALARYKHARELQLWFGGTVTDQGSVWSAPVQTPRPGKPARRRRNTC